MRGVARTEQEGWLEQDKRGWREQEREGSGKDSGERRERKKEKTEYGFQGCYRLTIIVVQL